MKKKIFNDYCVCYCIVFGYKLITDSSDLAKSGTIPLCHILGHSYFTNDLEMNWKTLRMDMNFMKQLINIERFIM